MKIIMKWQVILDDQTSLPYCSGFKLKSTIMTISKLGVHNESPMYTNFYETSS